MNTFQPEKLSIVYREDVTKTEPIIPRKYTLTHSDFTGELFLTIGKQFAWDQFNSGLRDEVIGEWRFNGGNLFYHVYLLIAGKEHDLNSAIQRNEIFRRELPLALTAIRYGDRHLFERFPNLDGAPIIVNFLSIYPSFNRQENWGTFHHYSI